MPVVPLSSSQPYPPPKLVPMESSSTLRCIHVENSDDINTNIKADATNGDISSNAALWSGARGALSCAYWLPVEIWLHHVFPYFYPSQLAAFSLVSQHMRMLVLSAPAWQLIYRKSMLSFREPLPQRLSHAATDTPGSSGLREARWEIKEYVMKVVCAFSFLKTEAFSTVDATIHASSLSVLTCPIIPAPASSIPAIVLTVTNVPEASITHPCVRLCLQCRQDLFEKHPEKLIPSVEGSDKIRITRHRAISKYVLEGPEILISNALSAFAEENPSITPDLGHHLPHREVLQTARRVHGGQVGVEAILSCGMGKAKIVSSLQREALFRSEWAALSSAS